MNDAEHLKPGTEIAGYRVEEKFHVGGMAVLYRVTPLAGGEAGVLKVPKLEFGSHPVCYAGFDVERMILERIAGPGVPRLFAGGEGDFGPYLVIEHIAGTPLVEYARRAPLAAKEVARLGAALASALHDLHRQEVVHHDLKPEHVILLDDGRAVLIDFGLAFHGHFGVLLRAYAYILSMGAEGFKQASRLAVLNANYVRERLKDVLHIPYDRPCMHECVFSDRNQQKTGITTLEMAKRLMDYGYHPPTIYFPLIVHGALMIEPTESEPKASLDQFIEAMKKIAVECQQTPDHPPLN